ncbi:MAG: hypothetical protein EOO08_12390 [Chitinophagaceae bacterium]|nr:MAG: hypothetical protein EOO08_12390 [Chitinophagaceae bacterium]
MSEVQDSTHGRGIADLRRAVAINRSLGPRYTPVDPLIQNEALDEFCNSCMNGLSTVYTGERAFNEARGARKLHFEGVDTWGTQLANNLKGSKATASTVKEARDLVKKIRGQRLSKEPATAASATPADEVRRQISAAQTTFDNRLEHTRKLVALARGMGAAYQPAAEEMKLESLDARLSRMVTLNDAVAATAATYGNSLIARDRLLYDAQAGAPARMDAIRTWYVSAFGAGSAERKRLNGLRVKNLSIKKLQAI